MLRAEDVPRLSDWDWWRHFGDGRMCMSRGGRIRITRVSLTALARMNGYDDLPPKLRKLEREEELD